MFVEKGDVCEFFVLSTQFCYEPKTALQIKFIKIYEQIFQILMTSGYTALSPLSLKHIYYFLRSSLWVVNEEEKTLGMIYKWNYKACQYHLEEMAVKIIHEGKSSQ